MDEISHSYTNLVPRREPGNEVAHTLVQMKGNLSQIYPIPFPSQKNQLLQTNLLSKFERNLHNSKFDAITAVAP